LALWLAVLLGPLQAQAEPDGSETPSGDAAQARRLGSEAKSNKWLNRAYRHKARHRLDAAERAFLRALDHGADAQIVALELGYLAAERGDGSGARKFFRAAMVGSNTQLTERAEAELDVLGPEDSESGPASQPKATAVDESAARIRARLEDAYRKKKEGDLAVASAAFIEALEAGADPQLVSLELGYLAAKRAAADEARARFREAEAGPDRQLSRRATEELAALDPTRFPDAPVGVGRDTPPREEGAGTPKERRIWADLYGEAYGWHRAQGNPVPDDLVMTVRARALYRLVPYFDFNIYAFGQGTRDVASRAAPASGIPAIYADDYGALGLGALVRLWDRRIALFLQGGPAMSLLPGDDRPARWDVRGGAVFGWEAPTCVPRPDQRVGIVALPCAEAYSEGVYVSRFAHDVIGFARGRAGLSYLALGPVVSQWLVEARAGADKNGDYYNNFADGGFANRLRLLEPFRFDATASLSAGSYLGRSNTDPAPISLRYVELRLQAATYVEF
jgi:hypothetical protein